MGAMSCWMRSLVLVCPTPTGFDAGPGLAALPIGCHPQKPLCAPSHDSTLLPLPAAPCSLLPPAPPCSLLRLPCPRQAALRSQNYLSCPPPIPLCSRARGSPPAHKPFSPAALRLSLSRLPPTTATTTTTTTTHPPTFAALAVHAPSLLPLPLPDPTSQTLTRLTHTHTHPPSMSTDRRQL